MPEALDRARPTDEGWLTVDGASRFLGVHPTTLRRWVAEGALPCFVTPGGHRRFRLIDLERFGQSQIQPSGQPARPRRDDSQAEMARLLIMHTRAEIAEENPLADLTPDVRDSSRQMGQRLISLLLHFAGQESAGGKADEQRSLEETREIGRQHGLRGVTLGQSLQELLRVAAFFRTTLVEETLFGHSALPLSEETPQAEGTAQAQQQLNRTRSDRFSTRPPQARLLRRIERLLDEFEQGLADAYSR